MADRQLKDTQVINSSELILGIETSCDDTAAALVDKQGNVIAAATASQIKVHEEFGGVYPELASRAHVESILPVVESVIKQAQIDPKQLKAIGVTRGPGLIGSLLVGINSARGLGLGWGVPVVGINHLRGHLRSADLECQRITFPAIVLLVSGGHTFLAHLKSHSDVTLLGTTRDDSVGEAYDKVGRMLGLKNLGGPAVDKLAASGEPTIKFPRPMLREGYEFSFSGLKSAVSRFLSENNYLLENGFSSEKQEFSKEDIAASFVEAAIDVLMTKCKKAVKEYKPKSLVIVGGVSASKQLRTSAQAMTTKMGVELCLPPLKWSTDNAAMIALATWDYIADDRLPEAKPDLSLALSDY